MLLVCVLSKANQLLAVSSYSSSDGEWSQLSHLTLSTKVNKQISQNAELYFLNVAAQQNIIRDDSPTLYLQYTQ